MKPDVSVSNVTGEAAQVSSELKASVHYNLKNTNVSRQFEGVDMILTVYGLINYMTRLLKGGVKPWLMCLLGDGKIERGVYSTFYFDILHNFSNYWFKLIVKHDSKTTFLLHLSGKSSKYHFSFKWNWPDPSLLIFLGSFWNYLVIVPAKDVLLGSISDCIYV